ncbi:MAG: hypothetical protein VCG02_18980 [Verrucomicrobiota bacterium]
MDINRLIFLRPLLLFPALLSIAAAGEIRAYPYLHADSATVEQVIRELVEGEYKRAFDRRRQVLLVSAPDAIQQKIVDILQQVDRPVRNVQVQVTFKGQAEHSDKGASVSGDGVIVDRGGKRKGFFTIRPELTYQSESRTTRTQQLVTTRSGGEARLQISTEVPYLEWLIRWNTAQARVNWQSVGSYLVVQPVIVGEGTGERVKIKLTPELSGMVDGKPHAIRYARVSTDIIARNGETIKIGGHISSNEVFKRFLFGVDQHGRHEITDITVTPTILDSK